MSENPSLLDSTLETGHLRIDSDHRELLRQLEDVRGAIERGVGSQKTVDMIVLLQRYTLGHFLREEELMRRVSCPTLERNMAAHREFLEKVEAWLDLLTMSGTPLSVLRDVQREAEAWIRAHIAGVDCGLRGCPSRASHAAAKERFAQGDFS
jgi:hemerythrin-like metal-binding protein